MSRTKRAVKTKYLRKRLGATRNKKQRSKLRAAIRLANQPTYNTKPERETMKILESLKVSFIQQFPLSGFYYDFMLPEHRILIEVNGDYFHANPLRYTKTVRNKSSMQKRNYRRDRKKLAVAVNNGYRIIYIWERDLKLGRKVRTVLNETINAENAPEKRAFHILEEVFPQYKDFYYSRQDKK